MERSNNFGSYARHNELRGTSRPFIFQFLANALENILQLINRVFYGLNFITLCFPGSRDMTGFVSGHQNMVQQSAQAKQGGTKYVLSGH